MDKEIGITIDKIMQKVFMATVNFFNRREMDLENGVDVVIADDMGLTGCMVFNKLYILENEKNNKFIAGFGKKCGNYVGNQYGSEFMLIKLEDNFDDNGWSIIKQVEFSKCFKNSLFFTQSGEFMVGENAQLMYLHIHRNDIEQFIVKPDKNSEIILNGQPVIEEIPILYDKGLVDYLAEAVKKYIQSL
jgi:hypothetical protein